MALEVPVAFCIFNRPEVTARTFAAIRAQRPRRLLLIGDGPRTEKPDDARLVQATRAAVLDQIDWPCEIATCLADQNLGCRQRMATGIGWAFSQAQELIILEDDCFPHPDFFGYCQDLLRRYAHDPRVMMISGDHFHPQQRGSGSYYFSHWAHIWGWASWQRAWQHYDLELSDWNAARVETLLPQLTLSGKRLLATTV